MKGSAVLEHSKSSEGARQSGEHELNRPASEHACTTFSLRESLVLGSLMLAYFLSYFDRSVVAIMLEPIKASLGITETQVSLLAGFSFAIFYASGGLVLGYLADCRNRRRIVLASVLFWSLATSACGLASGFVSLFLMRVCVGIGEAGLNPAAISLLSDYYDGAKRRRAMVLYMSAGTIGAAGASVIGPQLLRLGGHLNSFRLPQYLTFEPWQWAFILAGLAGIAPLLLLMSVLNESERRGVGSRAETIGGIVGFLGKNGRVMVALLLGPSLILMVTFAYFIWSTSFAIRVFNLSISKAALLFFFPISLFTIVGNFLCTGLSERLVRMGYKDAPLRASLMIVLFFMFPVALAPLIPNLVLCVLVLPMSVGMLTGTIVLPIAAIQTVFPNQFRGRGIALFNFVAIAVGYGIGPTAVALLTENLFGDANKVSYSLSLVSAFALPCAALAIYWGLPSLREFTKRMEREVSG